MKRFGFRSLLTFALCFALVPALAFAEVPQELPRDFRPVTGVVVMPVQAEGFLIDLDASKGMRVGDLVAVVKSGEKIIHPETGAILGTLDEVKGILQVTRIKSGYSYATAVTETSGIDRGDRVRRFENISAAFWDYTGQAEAFFAELKTALPTLDWQDYASAQLNRPQSPQAPPKGGPLLVFVLQQNGLTVRGPSFKVLGSYPAPASLASMAPAQPQPIAPQAVPAPAPVVAPSIPQPSAPESGAIVRSAPAIPTTAPATGAIVRQKVEQPAGLWFGPDLNNVIVGVEVADLDGDGQLEIATAFPHKIEIGRNVGGQYSVISQMEIGFAQKALTLDGADLDGDGKTELYITAAANGSLASMVAGFTNGSLRIEKTGIPMYFRSMELPGEGRVLLGQRMGQGKNDFASAVFRVVRSGSDLVEGSTVQLPAKANLFGVLPMAPTGNKSTVAFLTERDRLQILSPAGDILWEGEDRFGGSEAFIERLDPTLRSETGINTRNVFLQARIEPGPSGEILLPANEGSRIFAQSRQYKKSRLVAMVWDGHTMRETWHTQPQEGYMADFRLADYDNDGRPEVLTGVVFSREGITSKGRSALVGYELD